MDSLRLMGIDPSMSNWGYALADFNLDAKSSNPLDDLTLTKIDIFQPSVATTKQSRVNMTDYEKAKQSANFLRLFLAVHEPHAIFVEFPVGSKSSRAMVSYAMCIGVLGALAAHGYSFINVTATAVKEVRTGDKAASKHQMIDSAVKNFPDLDWPYTPRNGVQTITAGKAEHMADAIGCIEAGLSTSEFADIRQLLTNIKS